MSFWEDVSLLIREASSVPTGTGTEEASLYIIEEAYTYIMIILFFTLSVNAENRPLQNLHFETLLFHIYTEELLNCSEIF